MIAKDWIRIVVSMLGLGVIAQFVTAHYFTVHVTQLEMLTESAFVLLLVGSVWYVGARHGIQ